jgi:ribonucleoside-diphosphate reductase alpha chain
MGAPAAGGEWPLAFPCASQPGVPGALPPRVHRRVRARELWDRIVRASYDYAEPGVVFIDRVRREDNLRYAETIHAVNPCGEIPLPEFGACDLGSLNLTAFVDAPFTQQADLDWNALRGAATLAVRMLDDVYEITGFPLPRQREVTLASRRIGLGITGLADALAMLGITYCDDASLKIAADVMREICHAAYRASIELAKERGAFPAFAAGPYLEAPFVAALPGDIRAGIAAHGIRNSHLTAIAPAGSISLLANNVSSGLEPVFAVDYRRAIRGRDGSLHFEDALDYAVQAYRIATDAATHLPPALVTAADVDPERQLAMQAALQPYVDNAISKTVGLPADFPFAGARGLFESAYARGLKGCTVYRPNAVTGAVLVREGEDERCCGVRRPLPTEETPP